MKTTTPLPLDPDFGERIEALRREADERGHGDIGYMLEMAGQIADRRIAAGATPASRLRVVSDQTQP